MKTSQKIILVTAAIITVLIFTTMVIIRDDIQTLFVKEDQQWKFRSLAVDKFDRLKFSAEYQADVVSGLEYSVQIAVKDSSRISPEIEVVDGTLYFSVRDSDSLNNKPGIKARITMPVLKSVFGGTGSDITIRNFQADSMSVRIEKGCALKGRENVIKFLTFQTGDALVEWTNNP